jgi:hypothetical protein
MLVLASLAIATRANSLMQRFSGLHEAWNKPEKAEK